MRQLGPQAGQPGSSQTGKFSSPAAWSSLQLHSLQCLLLARPHLLNPAVYTCPGAGEELLKLAVRAKEAKYPPAPPADYAPVLKRRQLPGSRQQILNPRGCGFRSRKDRDGAASGPSPCPRRAQPTAAGPRIFLEESRPALSLQHPSTHLPEGGLA